jgi:TRAP-type C4-dicarboxylate transport system permease small subunit
MDEAGMIIVGILIIFFTLLLFYFIFRTYQINTEIHVPLLDLSN